MARTERTWSLVVSGAIQARKIPNFAALLLVAPGSDDCPRAGPGRTATPLGVIED